MSLSKWLPCDFEQCHPLLWSGGFLVNHWSTISSYIWHKWSLSLEGVLRVTFFSESENLMRGCVAYNDIWPWHIFSRSFGLDLENRVRSIASTVLDGVFPYLVQMITSMRRCVASDDVWPCPISSRSLDLDFENRVHSVTFSVLDRLIPYLPQIISTIRGCVVC